MKNGGIDMDLPYSEFPVDYRKSLAILAFPQKYSNDPSSNVVIKSRCGRNSKSNVLKGFELYDLRNPTELVHSEEFEDGLIMQHAPNYAGSGKEIDFDTEFQISQDVLYEGEFRAILRNGANQTSHPVDFIVRNLRKDVRVGLMHPTYTWHAYNTENGGSFYWGDDFEGED